MPEIKTTIAATSLQRVLDAFEGTFGYQATIDGVANPETKAQFAERQVALWIKRVTISWEADRAAKTARDGVVNNLSIG